MIHEIERPSTRDRFFICGGWDGGGGVIGTRDTWDGAVALKVRAIKAGYTRLRILTYDEMMSDNDGEEK